MFIPLRIDHDYEGLPYTTLGLVVVNVVVHILLMGAAEGADDAYILDTGDFALYQLITAQFLHGGFVHLVGNMVFLLVYGRYVEARLGGMRFLGAYLLCGMVGMVFYAAAGGGRAKGASAGITGLMGFVVVAAAWVEVTILFWMYAFVRRFRMAAFWLIAWWFAWEVFDAMMFGDVDRIAHSAHFGGFAAGAAIAWVLRSPYTEGSDWHLEPGPYVTGVKPRRRHVRPSQPGTTRAPVAVVFQSIADTPSRVAVIKLLMTSRGLEPDDAHERLSQVAAGTPYAFEFASRPDAERFAATAESLGVNARIDVRRRTI